MKNVVLLGSTGSIGTSTLKVVEDQPDRLRLMGLAAGSNLKLLVEQARRHSPSVVSLQDPAKATEQELRGQALFLGKAQCGSCHAPPYYTDNTMHNLRVERFFEEKMINGRLASADGPIKTFPLRGIKDSPPYLHDGRLLTLDDTVEFFNLILSTRLTEPEKKDLVAFLKAL